MSGVDVQLEEQKLTLRIKSRQSQNGIMKDVSTKQTIDEFLKRLSPITGVGENQMTLLTGFPPKRILFERSALLETLGLSNQDTLIVEVDPTGGSKHQGNSPAASVNSVKPLVQTKGSIDLMNMPSSEIPRVGHPAGTIPYVNLNGESPKPGSKRPPSPSVKSKSVPVPGQSTSSSAAAGTNPETSAASGTVKNQLIINALNSSTKRELDSLPSEEIPSNVTFNSGAPTASNLQSNIFQSSDLEGGMLLRQVVPSDNSCLFTSISFCLSGTMDDNDVAGAHHMRELIAATVESDPTHFNEAMLGRPNPEYVTWIMKSESWGGGIELSILSDFYGMEISVVDIQSLHISRFGEDKNYTQRMLLLYDGIHYDPLYMDPFDGSRIKTLFPTSDNSILEKGIQLGKEAKAAHQFTDLSNFSLKCGICNTLIRGQTEAQAHAKQTGHTDFSEIIN